MFSRKLYLKNPLEYSQVLWCVFNTHGCRYFSTDLGGLSNSNGGQCQWNKIPSQISEDFKHSKR